VGNCSKTFSRRICGFLGYVVEEYVVFLEEYGVFMAELFPRGRRILPDFSYEVVFGRSRKMPVFRALLRWGELFPPVDLGEFEVFFDLEIVGMVFCHVLFKRRVRSRRMGDQHWQDNVHLYSIAFLVPRIYWRRFSWKHANLRRAGVMSRAASGAGGKGRPPKWQLLVGVRRSDGWLVWSGFARSKGDGEQALSGKRDKSLGEKKMEERKMSEGKKKKDTRPLKTSNAVIVGSKLWHPLTRLWAPLYPIPTSYLTSSFPIRASDRD
jgi:hypothetical protein